MKRKSKLKEIYYIMNRRQRVTGTLRRRGGLTKESFFHLQALIELQSLIQGRKNFNITPSSHISNSTKS